MWFGAKKYLEEVNSCFVSIVIYVVTLGFLSSQLFRDFLISHLLNLRSFQLTDDMSSLLCTDYIQLFDVSCGLV